MHFLPPALLCALLSFSAAAQPSDAVIGEVLGQPVRASQLPANPRDRAYALRDLVVMPAVQQYLHAHRAETALTPAEAQKLAKAFNASMACQGGAMPQPNPAMTDMFVQMMGGNTKAQRHIYQRFGQGRVLFQQGGMEAFDATYRLIQTLEQDGKFKFANPADRTQALAYWTTDKHGPYLMRDPGMDQAFLLEDLVEECPAS